MINLKLLKSKHGPTYKVQISGSMGKIGIKGETTSVYIGLDKLTPTLARQITTVSRTDSSGKPVPPGTRQKIEKAVLEKLSAIPK